jgi:peptidoglycan hydrolase CwlO-like protein
MKQLDLFPELIEPEDKIEEFKTQLDKTRKALFQEQTYLKKQMREMAQDLELLKMNICRGRLTI